MNLTSSLVAASLCLFPLCSQAGVLYQWTATSNEAPWGITLDMEFSHRTVKSGEFKLQLAYDEHGGFGAVPRSGILGMRYTFPGMSNAMDYSARGGRGYGSGGGILNLDLKFIDGGFLAGSIYANDTRSHIDLASTGSVFRVRDANSDEGMPGAGCGWQENPPVQCAGASGFIQRVGEVPEPASITLLALGLAGLAGTRARVNAARGKPMA